MDQLNFKSRDFVHLHLHSDYSLLQSTIKLKPLAKRLGELTMQACGLTDYGNMYGAVSFYKTMKEAKIRPIIGYDAYVTSGSRFDRDLALRAGERPYYNLVLLAKDLEGYFKKIDKLKDSKRDVALTTDIIVGFPGETEWDFEETKRAVEYCGFDSAYILKYSPRPGTPAFEMEDDVTPGEKKLRFLELENVQKRSQNARLKRYLGKTVQVLAERISSRSADDITGHSTCHKLVNFHGSPDLIGNVVDVRIREIKANSLFGEVC